MDEKLIRLSEENNVPSLIQLLSTVKNQKVVDLLEARALEGRGEPVPYLQAVFKGSPSNTKAGLDRRSFVYKHAIQILNQGDLGNKVATDIVGYLLMELDAFPGRTLAELADIFIDAIRSGSLSNGKSLELFPKVLSAVAAKDSIPMPGECGGEMKGQEFKSHLLNTLCSSRWDPQCAIHLAAVFRDIPMTSDELRFVTEKIVRAMKDLDLQELPPLVYQLLLLSTKGHKQLVLEGVTSFFNNLDETCRKEDKEDSPEVQSMSKDQLRHMEGTVILHITFAVKQDQDLGREFVKYLKAHQSTPGTVLTPFNIALALSVAQIHRFEETVFDYLKSSVLRSFKDEERRKLSKWVKENIPESASVQDQILETVQNSLFGWDHVTQGLVQLGFTLMDAFGPKIFESSSSPKLSPTQQSCQLGSLVLLNTFKAHEMVRSEILQQILNRVVTKATSPVTHYIDLLASTVSSAPHVLLESLPRVKEALDYLSFLPPSSAEGLLKAIQPLLKISLSLRDSLILVLRKAMFSRQVDARKIAVTGFLLILKHFKILGGGISSSQPASQLSQSMSHSSQIQVDVHVRGSNVGNEALCLEILGNLRRCLSQQAGVRVQLYKGLFDVLCRNPQLRQPILDMLNMQFQKYYESVEDVSPPIKLEPCLTASGDQVFLAEPLAHLLCYLQHSTAKCVESQNSDEDNDCVEHILNELEDLPQSLVRRMNKCEMEDFELDKSADFSLGTSVGIKNNILALLVLGVYEILLEYSFSEGELSAESTEEIVQLFENYNNLSEILKEKASTAGKKGRSSNGKQGAKSMMSLECAASLLRALFIDTVPGHQQSLTVLRGLKDLLKYVLTTALQKLKEINEGGVCSGPDGCNKENVFKQCCTIGRVFWKHLSGESCLQEEQDKKDKGKKVNSLCVEGFCLVVNIMCCHFSQKLPQFLSVIDTSQEGDEGAPDHTNNQDLVYAQIRKFQRLVVSMLSSPDDDSDVSLKDSQTLVNIISLLAHHLDPDGQQFNQLHAWAQRICADHNIDDTSLAKSLMSLLYSVTFQCKTSASLVREVAQDVHSQLGDVDEEVEVEDRTHYAIINPRTAAPTVALLLVSQIEKIVDEMDWALVRIKGDAASSSSTMSSLDDKAPDSPDSCPRGALEQAVCHRLCSVVAALHELAQSALPDGPCTQMTLKVLTKMYVTLGSLAKHYLLLYSQRLGHLPAKFEKLVKMTGTHLSQQVYALLTYIQATQSQTLLEQSTVAKSKAKDKKKIPKGQNPVGKAKVMKEVKSVPNLIYAIEQYERYLIQLSKKSKINLMEHFKRSTARDFRINGATLEAALREESSGDDEDDDNDDDEEHGEQEEVQSEGEDKEPPKKRAKVLETKKKGNKLSLKQKN